MVTDLLDALASPINPPPAGYTGLQMTFTSGAGDYALIFDGDLQCDTSVMVDSGVSTMTIIVPEGINAYVTVDSGLVTVNTAGDWSQDGDVYKLAGDSPTLTITLKWV